MSDWETNLLGAKRFWVLDLQLGKMKLGILILNVEFSLNFAFNKMLFYYPFICNTIEYYVFVTYNISPAHTNK